MFNHKQASKADLLKERTFFYRIWLRVLGGRITDRTITDCIFGSSVTERPQKRQWLWLKYPSSNGDNEETHICLPIKPEPK